MASRQPSKQPAYTHTHTQSTPLTAEPHTHHPCVRDLICATVGLCIGRVTSWQAGGQASESLSLLSLSRSLSLCQLLQAGLVWRNAGARSLWQAGRVLSCVCASVCVSALPWCCCFSLLPDLWCVCASRRRSGGDLPVDFTCEAARSTRGEERSRSKTMGIHGV